MVELKYINGKSILSLCEGNLTYMGAEWGDTDIIDYNIFPERSIYPTAIPVRHFGYTNAVFKFFVEQGTADSAQLVELHVAELISEVTNGANGLCTLSFYDGDAAQYEFDGSAQTASIKRINRAQGVEISASIKGVKYIKRIYQNVSGMGSVVSIHTHLPSALRFEFTASAGAYGIIQIDDGYIAIDSLTAGNYVLDGRTRKFVQVFQIGTEISEVPHADKLRKLNFPVTQGHKTTSIWPKLEGVQSMTIYCYERLM